LERRIAKGTLTSSVRRAALEKALFSGGAQCCIGEREEKEDETVSPIGYWWELGLPEYTGEKGEVGESTIENEKLNLQKA